MPDLLVAVWGVQWNDFARKSLTQKVADFSAAAAAAHGAMSTLALSMKMHSPTMLFVAPEYYFVIDDSFTPLSSDQKRTVEQAIQSTSGSHANMVIVPGTINYIIELGPLKAKVAGTKPERTYGVQSYCPVYGSGQKLLGYYKRENDGTYDIDHPEHDAFYLPGMRAANFTFNNIHFGVDICKDLGQGRLAGDVGEGGLDVHICSSGTHPNLFGDTTRIAARDGGYFVHSDSDDNPIADKQKNGVWAVNRGKGRHGDGGHSASNTLTEATKNPAFDNYDQAKKVKMKMNTHLRRTGAEVTKNVTKQSALAADVPNFPKLKVYTCPML